MVVFFLRRFLISFATLFFALTATFFVMKFIPGGPFDAEKALAPDVKAALDAHYGLDQPLIKQYALYVKGVFQGDLGPSLTYFGSRSVVEIVGLGLPVSIQLGFAALIFALAVGIPLGVVASFYRNGTADFLATIFSVAGMSLPSFITATVMILVFSLWLGWLPAALWESPSAVIMPAIVLGLRPLALITRLTRASMIESLNSDYIRTAYAKGLKTWQVLFIHALKNSFISVLTLLGPIAASLLTGSFMVEVIFAIPGLGKYFVTAVMDRDYPLIMGVTMIYGLALILSNFIVDLLYGYVDPRIRVQS